MYLHVLLTLFLWGTMTVKDFGNKHVELLGVSSCFLSCFHPPFLCLLWAPHQEGLSALGVGWGLGQDHSQGSFSQQEACALSGQLGRGERGHQALSPQRVAGLLTVPVGVPGLVPVNSRQGSQHHAGLHQLTHLVVFQQTTCRTSFGQTWPMGLPYADPQSRSSPQVVILLSASVSGSC